MGSKYSEATRKLKAQQAKEQWAALSEEERAAIRAKQREAAKRMWAARTERERKKVGKLISEGRHRKATETAVEEPEGV